MVTDFGMSLARSVVRILLLRILRTDLEREYFLLLQENRILKRKAKRVPLTAFDRNLFVAALQVSRKLLSHLVLVKPETVVGWHRKVCFFVDGLNSIRIGRPSVSDDIRKLAVEMKHRNPPWGALRITNELGKLGYQTCKTSIIKILRENGLDPKSSRKRGITWRQFMRNHGERIFACDFFTVQTLSLQKLKVFFMIDIKTKVIEKVSVVRAPDQDWVQNQFRQVMAFGSSRPEIIIADRDCKFGKWLKPWLRENFGVELRQIPPRQPVFNAFAERMVRTFREELFDRILVFNEQDLRRTVDEYVRYYNESRVHSAIGPDSPCRRYELPEMKGVDRSVRPREVLGGVITDFEIEAA